jgi:lipopolysaccharide transport protein LptA
MRLYDGPRLVDDELSSQLDAEVMYVTLKTGDLNARQEVRHTLENLADDATGRVGEGPVVIASDRLEYEAGAGVARYFGEPALLRRGGDELRASEIRLHDTAGEGRRLEAVGDVRSRVHPAERDGATIDAEVEPIDASAESLEYSEERREIVYRGRVKIRQGDITTESEEATLTLGPDGRGIVRATAGRPVRIAQGERTANGDTATFDPARNVVHLVGDRVVLRDADQHIEGKSLTFHVADDTILVDGQDEKRTQTVFR